MFAKMKLAYKISILVGFFLITQIALGWFALDRINQAQHRLDTIYQHSTVHMHGLKGIADNYEVLVLDAVNKANAGMMPSQHALAGIELAHLQIEELWNRYRSDRLTPEETRIALDIEALFRSARHDIDKVAEYLAGNEGEVTGQLAQFDGALYGSLDPLRQKLAELIDLQLEIAEATYQSQQNIKDSMLGTLIGIVLGALVIGVGIALWIVRSVTQASSDCASVIHELHTDNASATRETRKEQQQRMMSTGQEAEGNVHKLSRKKLHMSVKQERQNM